MIHPLKREHVYQLRKTECGDCSPRGVYVFGLTLADVSDTSIAKSMTRLQREGRIGILLFSMNSRRKGSVSYIILEWRGGKICVSERLL